MERRRRRRSACRCSSDGRLANVDVRGAQRLRVVILHKSLCSVGNLDGWKCSARSSDKFSGATSGRCRQMVLQKPSVPLASFPRRLARCFRLLRSSAECSLSLVANVSSRFICDFFFHAHLVSLTKPLDERNPGPQFRPPQLIYSLPGWLHAEAVGGEKLQSGGQTWRERKWRKKKPALLFNLSSFCSVPAPYWLLRVTRLWHLTLSRLHTVLLLLPSTLLFFQPLTQWQIENVSKAWAC